ncbi:sporulation sigma-E factor-processing peptidase [Anaerotignum neopropionicum]|uniref:Sporulation sigma-E factor-processing peptidase n=1 Tax=Anaerotignum neopropionicum TaxID=36847 RepID=A0A136WFM2_9FIRM|nr:sigma-E processing peptidase SpoIIGA [Anaerotignum neopropionicum]KXL53159.1 sporulation sigma-E factor-processing peptidase [Anaerotignum neopropionicum]
MEASIYIDVLFFWEFTMDLFLLWAAGRISGFQAKKWRLILGAFLSALCHCLLLVFFFPNSGGIFLSFGLLILGLSVAYLPKSLQNFVRLFFTALFASFLLGGGLNVLFTATQVQKILGTGLIVRPKLFPWQYLLWGVAVGYIVLKISGKWIEAHIRRRRDFCTVYLRKNGKWTEGRVLIDTGNGLKRDGKGVIVMEIGTVLSLFSAEEGEKILGGEKDSLVPIHYTSLGNPEGALWGFVAEECRICFGEKVIKYNGLYIGISFELFTGSYEGLMPPCLLEEDDL